MSEDTQTKETDATEVVNKTSGLKRRTIDAPKQPIKKIVRNKMRKATKQDGTQNLTCSTMLVLPTDRYGLCSDMVSAMKTIASKVGGDKEKIKVFRETLKIMKGHVEAKHKEGAAKVKSGGKLKSRSEKIAAKAAAEAEKEASK